MQHQGTVELVLAYVLLVLRALARWGRRYGVALTFRPQTAELDCGVVP